MERSIIPQFTLTGIAILADVVSLVTFLGVQATPQIKLIVGLTLTVVAGIAAIVGLITSVGGWLSVRGAMYRPRFHVMRIGLAVATGVITVVLTLIVFDAATGLSR